MKNTKLASQRQILPSTGGGSGMAPKEVEEAILQHPAMLGAAAIGIPDPVHCEQVFAFVALRDGLTGGEDDTKLFLPPGVFKTFGEGLRCSRSARPDDVILTIRRPFTSCLMTSLRSFASSQTGSLGHEVRQASITCS